jgi:hypothetical protein
MAGRLNGGLDAFIHRVRQNQPSFRPNLFRQVYLMTYNDDVQLQYVPGLLYNVQTG